MSCVLVTGGLGFIGARLCGALLDDGFAVRCVDNLSGSYALGRGGAAALPLRARGAEVALADADPAHVHGVDAVIHLAALPGVRTTPARVGAVGRERRARPGDSRDAATAEGARLVLMSSSSVYGNARELPTPERARCAPQRLRGQQGRRGGRGAEARRRRGDRAALHGLRARPAAGDGLRALDRRARLRRAGALARRSGHGARLHLRGRRGGRDRRRAPARPSGRGLQRVRVAVHAAARRARPAGTRRGPRAAILEGGGRQDLGVLAEGSLRARLRAACGPRNRARPAARGG